MGKDKSAKFLLSSDSLGGYGLDLIFQVASELNFDGIDLALRKNFDAWNIPYVSKLIEKYKLPVNVIQVSNNVNRRELDLAVEMAQQLDAEVVCINAPYIYKIDTYKFIKDNINGYRKHYKKIKFAIINPPRSNLFALPIPKYFFSNIIEIIKKMRMAIGIDISNLEEVSLETNFMKKIASFIPHLPVVYLSDKDKTGKTHQPLGSGVLKLPILLKKFKQNEYYGYFSLKLELEKKDLADMEKVEQILKKCRLYYKENYEDLLLK